MLLTCHLIESFYQIYVKAEHCGFILYGCFHSVVILFAKIKQIYGGCKSLSSFILDFARKLARRIMYLLIF